MQMLSIPRGALNTAEKYILAESDKETGGYKYMHVGLTLQRMYSLRYTQAEGVVSGFQASIVSVKQALFCVWHVQYYQY